MQVGDEVIVVVNGLYRTPGEIGHITHIAWVMGIPRIYVRFEKYEDDLWFSSEYLALAKPYLVNKLINEL